ncbi:MAG: hypothetical protein QXG65_00915 [Thermoplasmata archaeon]
MAHTIALVPNERRAALDEILRDDRIARQSLKVRDAASLGGPAGATYVQVEGAADVVQQAASRLATIGTVLPEADRERVHAQFVAEDEAASAGMGLFFTEG